MTEFHVRHVFGSDLKHKIWQHAAEAHGARGMEHGPPDFGPASKAYDKLIKENRPDVAKASEGIVTNRSWPGQRLKDEEVSLDDEHFKCGRCGVAMETPLHRRWQCEANKSIDHWSIKATKHLHARAVEEVQHACLWIRGIVPRNLMADPIDWIVENGCQPIEVGDFSKILEETKEAGSDGSGGSEKVRKAKVMSSAFAVVNEDTGEAACIYANVPGRQTVPRAEDWGLLQAMWRMQRHTTYTLVVDASCLLNAMRTQSKWYSEGRNGDLWSRVFKENALRSAPLNLFKAKSHIKDDEEWTRHDMNNKKFILNEAADAGANAAAEKFKRRQHLMDSDLYTLRTAFLVAVRIAVIEADVWDKAGQRDYAAKSTDKMKASKIAKVNEKYDEAIEATSKWHSTYFVGRWVRCRHCPAEALHSSGPDYWCKTPCSELVKRTVRRK